MDVVPDGDSHAHLDAHGDPDLHGNGYPLPHLDSIPDADAHGDAQRYGDGVQHGDSHPNMDSLRNAHGDAKIHTYFYGESNLDANHASYGDHTIADCDGDL